MLSFDELQRDLVKNNMPDGVCTDVVFRIDGHDMMGTLRGTLLEVPKDAAVTWKSLSDDRERVRFDLPGSTTRTDAGYHSAPSAESTFDLGFTPVPTSAVAEGNVLERYVPIFVQGNNGSVVVQRSGSQSGVETRDITMTLPNGIPFHGRLFWRPERRKILAAAVVGAADTKDVDRFLQSVDFF